MELGEALRELIDYAKKGPSVSREACQVIADHMAMQTDENEVDWRQVVADLVGAQRSLVEASYSPPLAGPRGASAYYAGLNLASHFLNAAAVLQASEAS